MLTADSLHRFISSPVDAMIALKVMEIHQLTAQRRKIGMVALDNLVHLLFGIQFTLLEFCCQPLYEHVQPLLTGWYLRDTIIGDKRFQHFALVLIAGFCDVISNRRQLLPTEHILAQRMERFVVERIVTKITLWSNVNQPCRFHHRPVL